MANKKKEKAVETIVETQEVSEITEPKVYNRRAYSMINKDNKYHLVCISYSSDLDVGSLTILESNKDSFEIQYSLEQAIEELICD